jgi:hypothetical protein
MIRYRALQPVFVENIPDDIENGRLYVSMPYATVIHRCCCGCGEEVVTPLSPTDWKLTFDGAQVSLSPSVGNWDLPCRSHYIIRDGRVIEAAPWSQAEIDAEHQRDRRVKAAYYGTQAPPSPRPTPQRESFWARVRRWWQGG